MFRSEIGSIKRVVFSQGSVEDARGYLYDEERQSRVTQLGPQSSKTAETADQHNVSVSPT